MIDKEKSVKDYMRKLVNKDIITKYLFIKTLEENYGDEYIKTIYRINPLAIRGAYNAIDEKERSELEAEIQESIAKGEIDLTEEAKKWHRESFKTTFRNKEDKRCEEGER